MDSTCRFSFDVKFGWTSVRSADGRRPGARDKFRSFEALRNSFFDGMLDSEAASPTSRRRFTLEAETAAKLDHPNIVPIFEVGEHDGQQFLSMKFIAGENLRKKISSGELCLTPQGHGISRTSIRDRTIAIVRLMATISRAVHHAHQHGVMHRDLKPANILVDREGQPHLTDFKSRCI